MSRFLLFVGHRYYPSGGWDDFAGYYETQSGAMTAADTIGGQWAHVVDFERREIVCAGERPSWDDSDPWEWTAVPLDATA